ncbi:atpC protein [Weissella kandleri]|uniref:ATP synthase epsilon chain n=1 Tax=Weissella kandleri TaxID=1616 RepID=A0A0R2JD93_9LACO|nr:F0F1 ATP synthase subunit epsilon [Weissella kandleri]KRN75295.1 atpC protein [Weissella kandleri]
MNEHSFKVSIVTPDGVVFEYDTATLVVLHTTGGELGIMANHVPVVTSLEISEVRVVVGQSDTKERLAVNGGFAEFSRNTLTIVADSAECSGDIDVTRAESARARAERALREAQEAHDEHEVRRAQFALRRAVTRIHAASVK